MRLPWLSWYFFKKNTRAMPKTRLLVVDDSFIVRRVITDELQAQPDMEVVGSAVNGRMAIEKVRELKPDLVILDIEMPEMDGLTALTELRRAHPELLVIMFSSLTELGAAATLEALTRGASDFFAKPAGPGGLEASRELIRSELLPAIRALCLARAPNRVSSQRSPPVPSNLVPHPSSRIEVVAIGASTGGPNALAHLFSALPPDLPVPIVVVQHMPPVFTHMLAERLTRDTNIPTVEATSAMELRPGSAWIAPGGHHLVVERSGSVVCTRIHQDPPENACRPAVDPLFRSVAKVYGGGCLAVVLTGMGRDGLVGCEAVRAVGGQVLAQDEATSVVWGMPGFVARAGLANKILSLAELPGEIERRVRSGRG